VDTRRALGSCLVVLYLGGCVAENGRDEDLTETSERLQPACAPAETVLGIDIASYQHPNGAAIDWTAVAASRRFVIIKASEGTGYTNAWYADDSTQARAHGMLVGAYHYLRYTSSGAAQAQNFLASVGGGVPAGDLPAMLDVEDTSDAVSPAERVAIMKDWLDTVEAASGRKPMIYSGSWYWGPYLGSPTGYGGVYPMVWAAYTASCPKIPDDFPGITIWQYLGGEGTTPGISAPCDQDMFYGPESELLKLVDRPPVGWIDASDCDSVRGWAQDPDVPTTPIDVHVYFGGPAGPGVPGVPTNAGVHREDLCGAIGSCEHGFQLATPLSLLDGQPREVHAYGIDQPGTNNAELSGSPQTLACAAPLPVGVRRHVVDPTSYAEWKLDAFMDQLPFGDASIDTLPTSGDLPSVPQLVQADDGSAEVWVVDGTHRRHVPDGNVMAAWRFDWGKIQVKPAAEVHALVEGPKWRPRPVLLASSDGSIWLVDDAPDGPPASGSGGSGGSAPGSGGTGSSSSSGGGKSHGDAARGSTETDDGCAVRAPEKNESAPTFLVALTLAGAFVMRRRCTRI
jgi:GH25 family lysozyme M1 (1,4-beta-N-acetylmuramidase)